MKMGISVVIPVKNEHGHLKELLPELLTWVDEILIMDDFSTDGGVDVAFLDLVLGLLQQDQLLF